MAERCIERYELLKLARISQIFIAESDVIEAVAILDARLSYTTLLQDIVKTLGTLPESKPLLVNVMREDRVVETPAKPLLELAPQQEASFFVVPVIIKHT